MRVISSSRLAALAEAPSDQAIDAFLTHHPSRIVLPIMVAADRDITTQMVISQNHPGGLRLHRRLRPAALSSERSHMRPVRENVSPAVEDEILPNLTQLFRDVFDDQNIVLRPETTADDIAGWDSMSQVRLAVEIERRFGIKIKSAKMEELRSVRGMLDLIGRRSTMAAM